MSQQEYPQQPSQPSQPLPQPPSPQKSQPQELTSRPSHQAPLQVGDSNFDSAIHINDDDDDDGMDSLECESFPPGSNLAGDEEVASAIRQ